MCTMVSVCFSSLGSEKLSPLPVQKAWREKHKGQTANDQSETFMPVVSGEMIICGSKRIELKKEGRLQYGKAYTAGDGSHTSLKYTDDILYVDCWGLIKTGAKLNLRKEVVDNLQLNGPVNQIYKSLSQKGEIVFEESDDGGKIYPDLKTGYSIFIDNTDKTEGYDHVMIYIDNLHYPDADSEPIKNAVVGIGSISEGLQVYDLDEYLPIWLKTGKKVGWGNQFE